jgi:hypothetical protein
MSTPDLNATRVYVLDSREQWCSQETTVILPVKHSTANTNTTKSSPLSLLPSLRLIHCSRITMSHPSPDLTALWVVYLLPHAAVLVLYLSPSHLAHLPVPRLNITSTSVPTSPSSPSWTLLHASSSTPARHPQSLGNNLSLTPAAHSTKHGCPSPPLTLVGFVSKLQPNIIRQFTDNLTAIAPIVPEFPRSTPVFGVNGGRPL